MLDRMELPFCIQCISSDQNYTVTSEQTIKTINIIKPNSEKGTFHCFQLKQDTTPETQSIQWVEEVQTDILKHVMKNTPDLRFLKSQKYGSPNFKGWTVQV